MEKRRCIICDKEYLPTYKKQQCCSRKCAAIMRGNQQKSSRILKHCKVCGKEMYVDFSHKNRKYCCRKCADIGRTTLITKTCEVCGAEFKVIKCRDETAKYCSIKCQRKSLRGEENCICTQCGKSFHMKQSQQNKYERNLGLFCSKECFSEYKKKAYSGSGNHQYGLKGPLNASFINDVLLQKNHNLIERMVYCPNHPFCSKGGRVKEHRLIVEQNYQLFDVKYFIEINGSYYLRPKITVHHIDGNHNNNAISNLMPCTIAEHRKIHLKMKRDNKTAVLKQGELLGSLEVGNQQPSTPLTKCEGSETRC